MTLKLRCLTAEDAGEACGLYAELFVDGEVARPEHFASLVAHPGTFVWGAWKDEALLGMATLHLLPNMTYGGRPYALVENVVTRAACRGQGVGKAVMTRLIETAWATGAYKIQLLTGRARGAAPFYETLGFTTDEKHGMVLRRAQARMPVR